MKVIVDHWRGFADQAIGKGEASAVLFAGQVSTQHVISLHCGHVAMTLVWQTSLGVNLRAVTKKEVTSQTENCRVQKG
jgi:Na+-transporting NADH:ubiquinone oxidoreductase subunit NqrA